MIGGMKDAEVEYPMWWLILHYGTCGRRCTAFGHTGSILLRREVYGVLLFLSNSGCEKDYCMYGSNDCVSFSGTELLPVFERLEFSSKLANSFPSNGILE